MCWAPATGWLLSRAFELFSNVSGNLLLSQIFREDEQLNPLSRNCGWSQQHTTSVLSTHCREPLENSARCLLSLCIIPWSPSQMACWDSSVHAAWLWSPADERTDCQFQPSFSSAGNQGYWLAVPWYIPIMLHLREILSPERAANGQFKVEIQ